MKIFILNHNEEIQKIASVIAKKLPTTDNEIRLFAEGASDCFNDMPVRDFNQTFWLGHSEATQIGDFNADDFVSKFHAEFISCFPEESQKDFVNHVYFLGSETALQQGDSESLAQTIANKLYAKGFNKVVVHAIANPPGDNIRMNLEFITKPGASSSSLCYQTGDVHGFLFSQEQENILVDIEHSIESLESKLAQQTEYRSQESYRLRNQLRSARAEKAKVMGESITFLKTNEILTELDRPHNTFIPNHPERRPSKNLEQEKAIVQIDQHIRLISNFRHVKRKRLRQLDTLKTNLRNETSDWGQPIHKTMKCIKGIFSRHTHTYKMLKQLSEIADKQKTQQTMGYVTVKPPTSVKQRIKDSVKKDRKNERPVMPDQMQQALAQIDQFVTQLRKEYADKRKWLGMFCPSTKDYKAIKLEQLAEEINEEYLRDPIKPQWIVRVQAATLDDKLMQSYLSKRTKNLLTNIIAGHAEHGIHDPSKFVKKQVPVLARNY